MKQDDGTQVCTLCGERKPLDQFWNRRAGVKRRDCIACSKARRKPHVYKRIPLTCDGCGIEFMARVYSNRPDGGKRYHSVECRILHAPPPPVARGADNNRFNGGLSTDPDGRSLIVCRDYTSIAYSRGVMAAHIGRLLRSDEIVHHINEDWTDDRIENLMITDRAAHMNMHREQIRANITYQTGDSHWSRRNPEAKKAEGFRRRKLNTPELEAEVRALRKSGASLKAIGERYGVSGEVIKRIVREGGGR